MKIFLLFVLVLIGVTTAKRCNGRFRAGAGCRARCNPSSGKREELFCIQPARIPCVTITGQECVLPFKYEGAYLLTCTAKNNSTKPWCPTGTDDNGEMVPGEWEFCSFDQDSGCSSEMKPTCYHICENPRTGVTNCTYEFSGGSTLGYEISPQYGLCDDKRWVWKEIMHDYT